jgi:hypothetical protein
MSLSAHQSGGGSLAQPQPANPNFHSPIMTAETVRMDCTDSEAGVGKDLHGEAQYLRDLTAADALGDRCFFDAMGEVIAARLNGRTR